MAQTLQWLALMRSKETLPQKYLAFPILKQMHMVISSLKTMPVNSEKSPLSLGPSLSAIAIIWLHTQEIDIVIVKWDGI